MTIQNKSVAEYHDYLLSIVNDRSLPRNQRMLANHKLKLLQSLVLIYEQCIGEDSLYWLEIGEPVLPEEFETMINL